MTGRPSRILTLFFCVGTLTLVPGGAPGWFSVQAQVSGRPDSGGAAGGSSDTAPGGESRRSSDNDGADGAGPPGQSRQPDDRQRRPGPGAAREQAGSVGTPTVDLERVNIEAANRAVVNIRVTYFDHSYGSPWNSPAVREASGTGFIIEGNRILTNAHVVSSANTVRVQRPSQRTDYEARVLHIAHDCDLAMLIVEDEDFFADSRPLEIGEMPELNSTVEVIGFPIGGDRVSITRGIVSRKGMDTYSHSRIDSHMIIQVDAAINPGNSGGPGLQDGKVIGIAFQTLSRGQNLGYLIPPEVIQKFLTDIEDGRYDGYIEFGAFDFNTENPALRAALDLERAAPRPDTGVYIYDIMPGASAAGYLQPGDVLLEINGHAIAESGDVEIDGELFPYSELIDNLEPGAPIRVRIWRDGASLELTLPAKRTRVIDFMRKNYDTPPEFLAVGGLVFQPVDANLMEAYGEAWARQGRADILYRYHYYLSGDVHEEVAVDVVLSRRLNDRVNLYAEPFESRLVETVNGEAVRSFAQFVELVERALDEEDYLILRFRDAPAPLVLRSADVRESSERIRQQYGLLKTRYVREERSSARQAENASVEQQETQSK